MVESPNDGLQLVVEPLERVLVAEPGNRRGDALRVEVRARNASKGLFGFDRRMSGVSGGTLIGWPTFDPACGNWLPTVLNWTPEPTTLAGHRGLVLGPGPVRESTRRAKNPRRQQELTHRPAPRS